MAPVEAQSASAIDPHSITARASFPVGAELLVRQREPGRVKLPNGQHEYMLMCTVGSPVNNHQVRSVLQTANGRREWSSCPQGQITLVPSGFPLDWDWNYRSESIHLNMQPAFVASVGGELGVPLGEEPELRPQFRIFDDGLRGLLHQLRDETRNGALGKDLVTSSLLRLIVARLYRASARDKRSPSVHRGVAGFSEADRRKSIEILNDRLREKFSLAQFAAEFDMSPFHFARQFKRATGFPPHEYQLQLRVARARNLLCSHPRMKIADIACDLGFSDESHFRRHFRRIVGVTPSEFRSQQ